MKKIILLILLIAILIVSFIGTVYTNRQILFNQFWTLLDIRLTRARFLDIGEEFMDVSWPEIHDRTYIITMYDKYDKRLEYIKNEEKIILLNSVITQRFRNDKFYVIAKDGYAVIDRNKTATICTSQDRVLLENVNYITRFEDFEKEEQELFDSLGFYTKESRQLGIFLIIACFLIVVLVAILIILVIKWILKK